MREYEEWPRVIDGETVWACCVSSISPTEQGSLCRHQWVPCVACGDYFDPTTSGLSMCGGCGG